MIPHGQSLAQGVGRFTLRTEATIRCLKKRINLRNDGSFPSIESAGQKFSRLELGDKGCPVYELQDSLTLHRECGQRHKKSEETNRSQRVSSSFPRSRTRNRNLLNPGITPQLVQDIRPATLRYAGNSEINRNETGTLNEISRKNCFATKQNSQRYIQVVFLLMSNVCGGRPLRVSGQILTTQPFR
jgi:hypothetical protein